MDREESKREREITFLLWLMSCSGIGSMKTNLCLESLGSAETVYHSSVEELSKIKYVSQKNAEDLMDRKSEITEARRVFDRCRRKGIRVILPGDIEWPLLNLPEGHQPPMLFLMGAPLPPDLATNSRSVLGALDPTERQKNCAVKMGIECAERGRVLIAGMDRGVASYAQTTCLKNGGTTIAVLPCGPDICYPADHRSLYEAILRNGTIISLWPSEIRVSRYHFHPRDELIEAMGEKTVYLGQPGIIRTGQASIRRTVSAS